MIVDTSAVPAVLFAEDDAARYARALAQADICRMSVASCVEAAIVVDSLQNAAASRHLDPLLRRLDVVLEPIDEEQAFIARQAYADFGKGRHPAGLNFGDCFVYALAKATREPLLFKGNDFARTDVMAAVRA
jgi:ribonuclease VapC